MTQQEYRVIVAYIIYWCNGCNISLEEAIWDCNLDITVDSLLDEMFDCGYELINGKLVYYEEEE